MTLYRVGLKGICENITQQSSDTAKPLCWYRIINSVLWPSFHLITVFLPLIADSKPVSTKKWYCKERWRPRHIEDINKSTPSTTAIKLHPKRFVDSPPQDLHLWNVHKHDSSPMQSTPTPLHTLYFEPVTKQVRRNYVRWGERVDDRRCCRRKISMHLFISIIEKYLS